MVDRRRNSTCRQLNRLPILRRVNGELGVEEVPASGDRTFAVGIESPPVSPNRTW